MAQENNWLFGFDFNVEEWDASGQNYETLAICRSLALARAVRAMTLPHRGWGQQYYYFALAITSLLAGGRNALSCLPYDVFDADLGERRSNGRSSSVQPSSVLCESQRRLLSVCG